jgi:peptidyl-prolyl cis-trans isomerase B (cyclophilin B)
MRRVLVLAVAALAFAAVAPAQEKNPVVVIETSLGNIKVELDAAKAPLTVKNFLGYVDGKFYDGTVFHRVMPDFMIQGGGYDPGMKRKKVKETIKNESDNGLSNVRGTIAMARMQRADSASSQFFINVVDNAKKLDREHAGDGVGYAVFGKVIDGMDVVDKIKAVKTGSKVELLEMDGETVKLPHRDVPVQDVVVKTIRRAS